MNVLEGNLGWNRVVLTVGAYSEDEFGCGGVEENGESVEDQDEGDEDFDCCGGVAEEDKSSEDAESYHEEMQSSEDSLSSLNEFFLIFLHIISWCS